MNDRLMSRRALLTRGALGAAGLVVGKQALSATEEHLPVMRPSGPSLAGTQGVVSDSSIDPVAFLEQFDYGKASELPDGRTLREYRLTAVAEHR